MDVTLRAVGAALLMLATASLGACLNFRVPGPEDPSPVSLPHLVDVTILYRQPSGCPNTYQPCDPPVVFFGSWMREGGAFRLQADPGSRYWSGVAVGVPVNYPPRGEPYEVRIYDPFLTETGTTGFTARRLTVGGEAVSVIDHPGGHHEHGLIYIDHNGQGHNPP